MSRRWFLVFSLILVLLLALWGCGGATTRGTGGRLVKGFVISSSSTQGIAGTTVSIDVRDTQDNVIDNRIATTVSDGSYELELPDLEVPRLVVQLSNPDFDTTIEVGNVPASFRDADISFLVDEDQGAVVDLDTRFDGVVASQPVPTIAPEPQAPSQGESPRPRPRPTPTPSRSDNASNELPNWLRMEDEHDVS